MPVPKVRFIKETFAQIVINQNADDRDARLKRIADSVTTTV